MRQLGPEDRSLDRIEPGVDPREGADVTLTPAIFADFPQRGRERRIVGRGHSGIAERAEIFRRIEAEAGDVADAPSWPTAIVRPMALCAILDNPKPMCAAEFEDGA